MQLSQRGGEFRRGGSLLREIGKEGFQIKFLQKCEPERHFVAVGRLDRLLAVKTGRAKNFPHKIRAVRRHNSQRIPYLILKPRTLEDDLEVARLLCGTRRIQHAVRFQDSGKRVRLAEGWRRGHGGRRDIRNDRLSVAAGRRRRASLKRFH